MEASTAELVSPPDVDAMANPTKTLTNGNGVKNFEVFSNTWILLEGKKANPSPELARTKRWTPGTNNTSFLIDKESSNHKTEATCPVKGLTAS